MIIFVYIRKIAKALRAALEAVLLIFLLGGVGGSAGCVGTWVGASLDAKFMVGDPLQLNHSAVTFAMVGMVAGGALGLLFGMTVMLSPFFDKLPPLFDKRKREGVNSSR